MTKDIGNNMNMSTTTKSSTTDVIKNVYDLYGCYFEWTLEAVNAGDRVRRGGYYSNSISVSYRNDYYGPSGSNSLCSSRFTLYIK